MDDQPLRLWRAIGLAAVTGSLWVATGCVQAPSTDGDADPVAVRDLPELLIERPSPGAVFDLWSPVRFDAFSYRDGQGLGCCTADVVWHANGVELGRGQTIEARDLPLGTQQVTVTATHRDGRTQQDQIEVEVAFLHPLVWDQGGEIWVYDGTDATAIAKGEDPAWSPTDDRILFTEGSGDERDLVFIDPDGANKVAFVEDDGIADEMPAWSPAGDRLAWVRHDPRLGIQVWVSDLDTQDAGPVSNLPNGVANPTWGNDLGLVFQHLADPEERNHDLHVVVEPGTDPVRITNTSENEMEPATFLSRAQLLVTRDDGDGEGADVELLDFAADSRTLLTDHRANDRNPQLSPDRDMVLFASDRDGVSDLYVMRLDGSRVTRVPLPASDEARLNAQWRPMGVY